MRACVPVNEIEHYYEMRVETIHATCANIRAHTSLGFLRKSMSHLRLATLMIGLYGK